MTFLFTKPLPMHAKQIDPVPTWEAQRLERQTAVLKKAEEGDAKAIAELRGRGLKYWKRNGKVIVGE